MSDGWRRLARGIRSALAHRQWVLALAVLAPLLLVTALPAGWQLDDHFHRSRILGYGDAQPLQIFVPYDGIPAHTQAAIGLGHASVVGVERSSCRFLPLHEHTDRAARLPALARSSRVDAPAQPALAVGRWSLPPALLYRRILGHTWVAGLAALLYAIDDAHAMPVVYLANRNALITTCFGLLTVVFYVDWCRRGRSRDAVTSALLFALALSAGEMAVATVAYLAAYVLALDDGPLITRLQRVVPHAAVFGVWALIYRLGGFGAQGNGFYLDPVGAPLTFVAGLMDRVPLLLLGQWTPIPAAMGLVYAPVHLMRCRLRIESLLVVALLIVLFFPLVRRDRVGALLRARNGVLARADFGAGPENRLLSFVGIGAFGLVALLVQVGVTGTGTSRVRRAFEVAMVAVLLVFHLCSRPWPGSRRSCTRRVSVTRCFARSRASPAMPR